MAAANAQEQLPALGHRLLYLPHHLFAAGARPTPLSQYARDDVPNSTLPFIPLGGDSEQTIKLPTETVLPKIIRNFDHSTQSKSRTQPASIINNLGADDKLIYVKRCPQLNERLRLYADPESHGVVAVSQEQLDIWREHWPPRDNVDQATRTLVKERGITTLGSFEWPSADDQWKALVGMAAWCIKYRFCHAWLSESEPATQSLVESQLLEVLEYVGQVCPCTPYIRIL